jgi:hypothetical protein
MPRKERPAPKSRASPLRVFTLAKRARKPKCRGSLPLAQDWYSYAQLAKGGDYNIYVVECGSADEGRAMIARYRTDAASLGISYGEPFPRFHLIGQASIDLCRMACSRLAGWDEQRLRHGAVPESWDRLH